MLFSIWRMRSRVTPNARPDLLERPRLDGPCRPKRISITSRSRAGSASSALRTFSRRRFSHGQLERRLGRLVLDEVAQLGVLLLADRLLQRHRQLRMRRMSFTSRAVHSSSCGDLLGRRLAAELLHELALHVHDLVQLLHHVHRDADGARLVGDRARHGLADPPGRVGRELVAAPVVELLDGADQAERTLLDEVQERQAAAEVALGDRDDQPQVGLDHVLLGGHVAALDALGERHLLVGGEQVHPPDRAQVEPQRVEARLDGQVDLRPSSARSGPSSAAATPARSARGGLAVLRHDLHAVLHQVRVQLRDLLLRDLDLLETGRDLLERQVAALTSLGDEELQAPRSRVNGASASSRQSSNRLVPLRSTLSPPIRLRRPAGRPYSDSRQSVCPAGAAVAAMG